MYPPDSSVATIGSILAAGKFAGCAGSDDWPDSPRADRATSVAHPTVLTMAALRSAVESLLAGGGDELVAFDLRLALEELGRVVGAVVTDDILDRIFRRFCIGK